MQSAPLLHWSLGSGPEAFARVVSLTGLLNEPLVPVWLQQSVLCDDGVVLERREESLPLPDCPVSLGGCMHQTCIALLTDCALAAAARTDRAEDRHLTQHHFPTHRLVQLLAIRLELDLVRNLESFIAANSQSTNLATLCRTCSIWPKSTSETDQRPSWSCRGNTPSS